MEDFSVVRGATTLRATRTESVGDLAVVFLHAGVADRRSWLEVMGLLESRGVRCVAYISALLDRT